MRTKAAFLLALVSPAIAFTVSCGGSGNSTVLPPAPISLSLAAGTLQVLQDGSPASVDATIMRPSGNTNSVTLTVTGLPVGLSDQITSPGTGDTGSVTFTSQSAAAGAYSVTITASDGQTTSSASLSVTVAIVATIGISVNTSVAESGQLEDFMTTSFQPADWDYQFFTNNPGAVTTLGKLGAQHVRLQPVSAGTPQKADQTWDFSTLNAILDPVIRVGDKSPELQLAVAPAWMDDSSGHLLPAHFQDFANYAAEMVKYYNTTTGFTDTKGVTHVHSATNLTPITWWGIFNEPNINGLTAAQYVQLYNMVVPAMQGAGSQVPIKFAAVELADFGQEPENYMPTFVANVTAQVDVVATHFYSSCNQTDTDQALFNTIPGFVSDVKYIYSELATNPALAAVPVWVTENNVNADFQGANGFSNCNPSQKFVTDQRGTSAYFAAWRPYVFSQLSQAGVQGLYHWDFDADQQYGEVDYNTGATYRSYWVDYWLGRYFPAPPGGPYPQILNLSVTETSTVETLAVQEPDGSVVIMIADRAVHSSTDDNGTGDPRTVVVDLSEWPAFSSASLLTIDANTDPTAGPTAQSITPAERIPVTLGGYGVAFLSLKP